MLESSEAWLANLRSNRIPGLSLTGDFLYPDYSGRSILNIPASICRWLGAPPIGEAAPLAAELSTAPDAEFRRVILVLVDALGYQRLLNWIERGQINPVWGRLARSGRLAPLTSIVPSTTSAALTTLWTGRSPAEHGIVGYEMLLKEYGIVANTIQYKPNAYRGGAGSLEQAGFKPEQALGFSALGEHLRLHGVEPYAFNHASLVSSSLSRMLMKDAEMQAFYTAADCWVNLRKWIEGHPDERMFAWVYWGEVDTLSHFYGPSDERPAAELSAFGEGLQKLFLDRLPASLRSDTLLVITADHGQILTSPDPYYDLRNHPGLTRRLHLLPTGEQRLAYLFIRPGQTEAVREYIDRTWPNQFALVDAAYAADAGLFGPGEPHPQLLDRVGDLVVIARGQAYFWWANKENILVGRHGGLSEAEMLVPLLTVAL